mgnify:CR=1 FL=1
MNIFLDNVNLMSTSGPNHFGNKLKKSLERQGHSFGFDKPFDIQLSFIQVNNRLPNIPLYQRLDGIYFNNKFDFGMQNKQILDCYNKADGVVFQTQFNKDLTFKYFGKHENYSIIRNGADLEFVQNIREFRNTMISRASKVWCCASSWRPHKRLGENVRYFLEHSKKDEILLVAGQVENAEKIRNPRIFYLGSLMVEDLISVYKSSDYFIHLAWLDHCPNVVADARACGCKIICSSSGGTKEIAGQGAIIIEEDPWDFEPVDLYSPPAMDFTRKTINTFDSINDMDKVATKYINFFNKGKK